MKFKPEELRAYYEKWYRPDLQGIIVVGDIDVNRTEEAIKKIFSPIQMPKNPAPYELYPCPTTIRLSTLSTRTRSCSSR